MTDYAIVEAMRILGGSFVRALAEAFNRADVDNFARLKAAFPDYWQEYEDLAQHRHTAGLGPT